jgi:hypothetical protein
MCDMLNLYVPVARPELGPPVRGLYFCEGLEVQRDFRDRFVGMSGIVLGGAGGGYCLCGFRDWQSLREIGCDAIRRNRVPWVAFLFFASGDGGPLNERVVDPEDPESDVRIERCEILMMQPDPPERRRHRLLVRALARKAGENVELRMKSGQRLGGLLASFDGATEVGQIGDRIFVAAEVRELGG